MAIIDCPGCKREVSSKAVICPRCGYQFGEPTEEDLAVFEARQLRDRIYRLNMISYLVITIFLVGFGWYWVTSGGFTQPPGIGPMVVMGLAAIAYMVVRVLLFLSRQKRKKMREKRALGKSLRRNL